MALLGISSGTVIIGHGGDGMHHGPSAGILELQLHVLVFVSLSLSEVHTFSDPWSSLRTTLYPLYA